MRNGDTASPGVSNVAVDFTILDLVLLGDQPPDLAMQIVLLNQLMHALALRLLLGVIRVLHIHDATDYDQVGELAQLLILGEHLHQARQVLDPAQSSHQSCGQLAQLLPFGKNLDQARPEPTSS